MLSTKPWRLEAILWFCAVQIASLCAGLSIISLLQKAGFAAFQPPAGFGAVLVGTLAFQGTTWVLISLFLRQHHVNWRDAFGLRKTQLSRALFFGVLVAIGFSLVARVLEYVSAYTLTKMGWPPEPEAAVTVLINSNTWWLRAYLGIFAVAIAPVAEEFIFRGMLYPFIKQRGRPFLAWVGVSFLFALVHWNAAAFVPLFLLALALTWLYERTGSLLAPITAHALFNAVNLALFFLFQYELKPG